MSGPGRHRARGHYDQKRRRRAVDGLNLTAHRGEVTALLGANGAGKTTTLACAQGLIRPSSGTVRLLGRNPWGADADLRSRVGIMLQDGGLPQAIRPLPLLEHIARMHRRPRPVRELAERLGIDAFAATAVRRLSGGQKQRVSLAAALIGQPEVLFLDEPSAGLDPQSRRAVFEIIREQRAAGTAIVLTTHLLDDAQRLADQVVIIERGAVVREGAVEQLLHEDGAHQLLQLVLPVAGLTLTEIFPQGLRPGLEWSETSPGSYELRGPLRPCELSQLSRWLTEHDIMPSRLDLQPRTLEDLFLEVSGEEIR